jgi:hypothetical protein
MVLLTSLAALVVFILLAFFRASITGWGLGVILTVFFFSSITRLSDESVLMIGSVLGCFFGLLGIPLIRRALISKPLLNKLRRTLVPITTQPTEMGLGGWETGLFNGHPDWKKWLALPKCSLSTNEILFLRQEVQQFCGLIDEQARVFSPEAEQFLLDKGFFKLSLAQDAGGLGFSAQACSAIISKIASHNRTAALLLDNDQLLAQSARDVGEMKQGCYTTDIGARAVSHTYFIDSAQKISALAADNQSASCVIAAVMRQQANVYAQRVFNDIRPPAATLQLRENTPAHLRSRVIFKQAALRLHPYLFREISALQTKNEALSALKFDAALRDHIRYTLSNMARSAVFGLTGGIGIIVPGGHQTIRYYQRLTRFSAAFALCTDAVLALTHRDPQQHEALFVRLGDIFSQLYLAAAALKRFEDDNRPKEDLPALEWAMQYALYDIQQNLRALLQNTPNGAMRWLLKQLVFPIGQRLNPPSDRLSAQVLATRSPRMTEGIYLPT